MFTNNIKFRGPSIELIGPSSKEVIHFPYTSEFGHSNNSQDPYTKTKTCK